MWIAKSIGASIITHNSITLLYSDPRRLLVTVRAKGMAINAAVLHALGEPHSPDEAVEWWDRTSCILTKHFGTADNVVIFTDANTNTSSNATEYQGGMHGTKSTKRTNRLALRCPTHCNKMSSK